MECRKSEKSSGFSVGGNKLSEDILLKESVAG
jgi:hypothetical protein